MTHAIQYNFNDLMKRFLFLKLASSLYLYISNCIVHSFCFDPPTLPYYFLTHPLHSNKTTKISGDRHSKYYCYEVDVSDEHNMVFETVYSADKISKIIIIQIVVTITSICLLNICLCLLFLFLFLLLFLLLLLLRLY